MAWKVASGNRDPQDRDVVMTYRVLAEGVSGELYESAQAHIPSQLMASGKMNDLRNLLQSFGVQALTALPQDKYGAFADGLRKLGANI